jgi:DNA-binding GntR family transcriptional regulator
MIVPAPPIPPVLTHRDRIAQVLERDIVTGLFPPGHRLVERELTLRFGVSSIPVREALQDLEGRGLVTRRPNCGYSVVELSVAELRAICQLRRILEPEVVRWTTERLTGEGAALLREQHARFAAAAAADQVSDFFHEDLQFHRLIWDLSGNRFAARALHAALGSLFSANISQARRQGQIDLQVEVRKHEVLLNQILNGDADAAAATLLSIADYFERTLPPV